MNSIETDLKRAVCSLRFFLGAGLQFLLLWYGGAGSSLYKISVPLVCALPYAGGWLEEYQRGFFRFSLVRGSLRGYVWGKLLACVLSGSGAEVLAAWLFAVFFPERAAPGDLRLVFCSGMVWAAAAALLAALSNSKYLAYGGAFVIYHFLAMLCERYWQGLYCLYPYEWLAPSHTWPFGNNGVLALLLGLLLLLALWHNSILKRRLKNA